MPLFVRNLLMQSAMAGWSDGRFCRAAAQAGAAIVTLGGYNADRPTHKAGVQAAKRRREFSIGLDELPEHIRKQAAIARTEGVLVCVNIRFALQRDLAKLCRQLVGAVDLVELNAHCRQPEFIKAGAGEALLSRPRELLRAVALSSDDLPTLVKARAASLPQDLARQLEDSGALALHLDLMKPARPEADVRLLRRMRASTALPIIGNNSVRDEESFLRMLANGANMASMARGMLDGPGPMRTIISSKRCAMAIAAASPVTSRGFRLG
mgnify:CR=1 FL=1